MQLYVELKAFFPHNRVEYFVSNFDFYQPEAYLPAKDLYIDKDVKHNIELDMMRMSATNSLLMRRDTIVVASVAAIYAAQNPNEYAVAFFEIRQGAKLSRKKILQHLIHAGYVRNDYELQPGTFALRGDVFKIAPAHSYSAYIRVDLEGDCVQKIVLVDPLSHIINEQVNSITIFPAQSYVTSDSRLQEAIVRIRQELNEQLPVLHDANKMVEYQRLKRRTEQDLQDLAETGFCSGIENYSRHLDLRAAGEKPTTLLDYFGDDFLMVIDESHMTIPQIHGMFNTNFSRKKTLIEYGFRLPSAQDNRPLSFAEFRAASCQTIYTSATPGNYELALVNNKPVEQIIRPTGLTDPLIEVRPSAGQVDYIINAVKARALKKEKVLVTTLTKRMSEELADYLLKYGVKAAYLHSELKTLERSVILNDLRRGVYDCVVGVNLLREGIDIPEISLICILDANKQGFLRNTRSLIQIIGRAARNINGRVVLFADSNSPAMLEAIKETNRRRTLQEVYNHRHNIKPRGIVKPIHMPEISHERVEQILKLQQKQKINKTDQALKQTIIKELERDMYRASKRMEYEKAAQLRDMIIELRGGK